MISGETDELDSIEPMIRDLDFQTVGSEAEIIRLVNVDPARIEPILTRMYGDSRGRSRGRGGPGRWTQVGEGGDRAYKAVSEISFGGAQLSRDIASRALNRCDS